MKKKVLYMIFLRAPSSVVRAEVFKTILSENGFEVDYYYHYSRTVSKIQDWVNGNKLSFLFGYLLRGVQRAVGEVKIRWIARSIGKYHGVILLKYIKSATLLSLKKRIKGKVLYDFDDAVWLPLFIGREGFNKVIQSVDFVSCDNTYLRTEAEKFNPNAFVLNGPCQIELFDRFAAGNDRSTDSVVIGWIGSPGTLFYLYSIYDALEEIGARYANVVLQLVGVGYDKAIIPEFEKMRVEHVPTYDQAGMVRYVKNFDIGLYPLFRNELSLGRGSLKATVYMASRVPAVCTSIGENCNFIIDGTNGFLAGNTEEWINKLELLINNPGLRKTVGQAGYDYAKVNMSLGTCYDQLYRNFLSKL